MKGTPEAMAIHIDINIYIYIYIDKRILKGRVGFVHSWVFAKDESGIFKHGKRISTRMPEVVFVKLFAKEGT